MTDAHQLSHEENERIFQEEIVPQILSRASPQRRPTVVFIGGQTGAGKTAITQMVVHALRQGGEYVNANMDFYTPHHPHYADLLADDEATASSLVRADTEQWWVKAQQYAINQRFNVIVETALRDPAEFEDLIPAFKSGDYTIEAAFLAVPEALSRLGILNRYWREVTDLGKGRLVEPTVHDECYRGVLRAAREVEQSSLSDSLFAFRRNGDCVYSNTREDSGKWTKPPRGVEAIQEERVRLWTAKERAWFDAAVTDLWTRIDPAWYSEIQQIQALAQPHTGRPLPMLTAPSQPVSADRPSPSTVTARPLSFPKTLRTGRSAGAASRASQQAAPRPPARGSETTPER